MLGTLKKKKHDKKILQVEFKTIILPTRGLMSRVLITQYVHIVKFFYFSSNSCISLKILYFPFTCYSIFDLGGGGGGFNKRWWSRNSRELAVYFSLKINPKKAKI